MQIVSKEKCQILFFGENKIYYCNYYVNLSSAEFASRGVKVKWCFICQIYCFAVITQQADMIRELIKLIVSSVNRS